MYNVTGTNCQLIASYGNCAHINGPLEEEEQRATLPFGDQRTIAKMVFPECLTEALGSSRDVGVNAHAPSLCESASCYPQL